jgi:Flp pilus assembly CpaF family ATPase
MLQAMNTGHDGSSLSTAHANRRGFVLSRVFGLPSASTMPQAGQPHQVVGVALFPLL